MSRNSKALGLSGGESTKTIRRARLAAVMMCLLGTNSATAAEYYLGGNIVNITSTTAGLMVALDTGVPTNCQGVSYGWMLIPESNKTMVAVALSMWATGSTNVVVYTNPLSGGRCVINQFDPA